MKKLEGLKSGKFAPLSKSVTGHVLGGTTPGSEPSVSNGLTTPNPNVDGGVHADFDIHLENNITQWHMDSPQGPLVNVHDYFVVVG